MSSKRQLILLLSKVHLMIQQGCLEGQSHHQTYRLTPRHEQ